MTHSLTAVGTRRKAASSGEGRFTAIDGARGAAIISVLLYHSGWSERGLFGVDMFFVVSGFLITFLLIKELSVTGRLRFGRFYARRAKRLLPGLVISLALTLWLVWSMGTLDELKSAAATAVASLLQVANWHQITVNNAYWESNGNIVPLGQMWSLSATEQFYILWPLFIALLWLLARRRVGLLLGLLMFVLIASALVAPLLFDGTNFDRLYLGTDSRAVSFVAGATLASFIAWTFRRGPEWAGPSASGLARGVITGISALSLGAVLVLSLSTEGYRNAWLYQGGLAIVSVAIALFTATLCFPANILARPFTWKPLVDIGKVSYSMFLLHLPVFWLLVTKVDGLSSQPLLLFVLGGFITWRTTVFLHNVITEPLRLRSWESREALVALVVSFGLIAAAAWYLPLDRTASPHSVAGIEAQTDPNAVFAVESPITVPEGHDGGPLKVAVIGDSVAADFYGALAEYRTANLHPIDITVGGCGIMDANSAISGEGYVMNTKEFCWPWQDKLRKASTEQQPDVYILHNLWDANQQELNGKWVGPGEPEWNARYKSQLELLISIGESSGHRPLILLSNDRARDPAGPLSRTRLDHMNQIAESVVNEHTNVALLDFEKATCPNGPCLTVDSKGNPIYRDGAHFSAAGLAILGPWLEQQMARKLLALR